MTLETCRQLALQWYGGRGKRDWQRPDDQQTQALFTRLGLTGEFWNIL